MSERVFTPIQSYSVAAFVITAHPGSPKVLLLRRCSKYLHGNWQMISGKIESGETAWQAAQREILEETGINPPNLYTVDILEQFYSWQENTLQLIPVFVTMIPEVIIPRLQPDEHDDWQWVSIKEAADILEFPNQIRSLEVIEEHFVKRKPSAHLEIPVNKEK